MKTLFQRMLRKLNALTILAVCLTLSACGGSTGGGNGSAGQGHYTLDHIPATIARSEMTSELLGELGDASSSLVITGHDLKQKGTIEVNVNDPLVHISDSGICYFNSGTSTCTLNITADGAADTVNKIDTLTIQAEGGAAFSDGTKEIKPITIMPNQSALKPNYHLDTSVIKLAPGHNTSIEVMANNIPGDGSTLTATVAEDAGVTLTADANAGAKGGLSAVCSFTQGHKDCRLGIAVAQNAKLSNATIVLTAKAMEPLVASDKSIKLSISAAPNTPDEIAIKYPAVIYRSYPADSAYKNPHAQVPHLSTVTATIGDGHTPATHEVNVKFMLSQAGSPATSYACTIPAKGLQCDASVSAPWNDNDVNTHIVATTTDADYHINPQNANSNAIPVNYQADQVVYYSGDTDNIEITAAKGAVVKSSSSPAGIKVVPASCKAIPDQPNMSICSFAINYQTPKAAATQINLPEKQSFTVDGNDAYDFYFIPDDRLKKDNGDFAKQLVSTSWGEAGQDPTVAQKAYCSTTLCKQYVSLIGQVAQLQDNKQSSELILDPNLVTELYRQHEASSANVLSAGIPNLMALRGALSYISNTTTVDKPLHKIALDIQNALATETASFYAGSSVDDYVQTTNFIVRTVAPNAKFGWDISLPYPSQADKFLCDAVNPLTLSADKLTNTLCDPAATTTKTAVTDYVAKFIAFLKANVPHVLVGSDNVSPNTVVLSKHAGSPITYDSSSKKYQISYPWLFSSNVWHSFADNYIPAMQKQLGGSGKDVILWQISAAHLPRTEILSSSVKGEKAMQGYLGFQNQDSGVPMDISERSSNYPSEMPAAGISYYGTGYDAFFGVPSENTSPAPVAQFNLSFLNYPVGLPLRPINPSASFPLMIGAESDLADKDTYDDSYLYNSKGVSSTDHSVRQTVNVLGAYLSSEEFATSALGTQDPTKYLSKQATDWTEPLLKDRNITASVQTILWGGDLQSDASAVTVSNSKDIKWSTSTTSTGIKNYGNVNDELANLHTGIAMGDYVADTASYTPNNADTLFADITQQSDGGSFSSCVNGQAASCKATKLVQLANKDSKSVALVVASIVGNNDKTLEPMSDLEQKFSISASQ